MVSSGVTKFILEMEHVFFICKYLNLRICCFILIVHYVNDSEKELQFWTNFSVSKISNHLALILLQISKSILIRNKWFNTSFQTHK